VKKGSLLNYEESGMYVPERLPGGIDVLEETAKHPQLNIVQRLEHIEGNGRITEICKQR